MPAASPRRRRRSARPARPRSRTLARRAGAARARASAASRTGRPRSRAGTPRSDARRRRSAGWCRSRSQRGGRPPRPRRCRSPGRAGRGSCRRFAVGKPSVPPRASPATTVPTTSAGRPSSPAARSTSPARSSSRIRVDETPSTSGTARASKPRPREPLEVARPAAAEAEVRARDHHLRPDRSQDPLGERLRLELGQLEVEVDDERLLDPRLAEQLEAPFERRQQLDAVAERHARMRVEGDDRRRRPGRERGLEDPPMPEVDAVEGPERDRPRLRLELFHAAGDDHSARQRLLGREQPLGVGLLAR